MRKSTHINIILSQKNRLPNIICYAKLTENVENKDCNVKDLTMINSREWNYQ